jgi:hypothetical protein
VNPEIEPCDEESELACEVLAGAALEGLQDLADGEVLEGVELERALRQPLQ